MLGEYSMNLKRRPIIKANSIQEWVEKEIKETTIQRFWTPVII